MSTQPPAEDPLDAAARALARRDRGFSAQEHAAFLHWLRAAPANAEASAVLDQVWRRLDLLRALCPQGEDKPDPDLLNPAGGAEPGTTPPDAAAPEPARKRRRPTSPPGQGSPSGC